MKNKLIKLLIKFWNTTFDKPYFIHKNDKINNSLKFKSYKKYIKSYVSDKSKIHPNDLHVGLYPVPYIGNIEKATLFILMKNPGFSHEDYIAEEKFSTFREALKENLSQLSQMSYPFLFLNPEFLWTGGGRYWEDKFGVYAEEMSYKKGITYGEALKLIANKVACLELVPYHSEKGVSKATISNLESKKNIITFFNSFVLQKAKNKEVGLIVARGREYWENGRKIEEQDNIFVYSKGEERSASIAPHIRQGRVGKMIRKYLF